MSDPPMTLRPAAADDAPALAVILRTCFRVSLPFLPELHTGEEDRAFMARRLAAPDPVWVAEVTGAPVGFITFREGWIDHLFIHPEHQGQGIGPALLAKALEDGRPSSSGPSSRTPAPAASTRPGASGPWSSPTGRATRRRRPMSATYGVHERAGT